MVRAISGRRRQRPKLRTAFAAVLLLGASACDTVQLNNASGDENGLLIDSGGILSLLSLTPNNDRGIVSSNTSINVGWLWQRWGLGESRQVNEHDLKHGSVIQMAIGRDVSHELGKWQILIREGLDDATSNSLEERPESRLPRQVRTQNQGVDEKPNESFRFRSVSIGGGSTDDHVGLAGVTAEQHVECRHKEHEESDLLGSRETLCGSTV